MTRKATFYQDDVERAIRAATSAGLKVGTVEIAPDGTIKVYSTAAAEAPRVNTVDQALGGK